MHVANSLVSFISKKDTNVVYLFCGVIEEHLQKCSWKSARFFAVFKSTNVIVDFEQERAIILLINKQARGFLI